VSEQYLELKNVRKYFQTPGGPLHAVDGVTFTLDKGHTIGVVGESGCGKSTLGRVVSRLLDATGGEIHFKGKNILDLKGRPLKTLRREIQMIFQDPFSSLNPRKTIYNTIADNLLTIITPDAILFDDMQIQSDRIDNFKRAPLVPLD